MSREKQNKGITGAKGKKGPPGVCHSCRVYGHTISGDADTDVYSCTCGWSDGASREKQIEEMAKVLCKNALTEYCASGRCSNQNCLVNAKALETLYNAGYRKQSEGCDFCKEGNEKCGTCVKFFDYHEDGGSDRCSSEYGNEKCAYYKPVHHCSNCGAKMKGGAG